MDLFALKKFVSMFMHPLPILIGAVIVGLALYFYGRGEPGSSGKSPGWTRDSMDSKEKSRRRRVRLGRFGISVVWLALLALYLLGLGPVSKLVVRPLQESYPIFDPATAELPVGSNVFVVVLSGGYIRAPGYPITSRLGQDTMTRLSEGVRIYREISGARLIVSGGDGVEGEDQRSTVADSMAEMAKLMGVPDGDVLTERDSRDTKDHPVKILPLVGDERRIILVTSAMHMRRAMALFEKQGYQPIAAPAGVVPSDSNGFRLGDYIPSARSYLRADDAVHEYLGLLWAKMRGQID